MVEVQEIGNRSYYGFREGYWMESLCNVSGSLFVLETDLASGRSIFKNQASRLRPVGARVGPRGRCQCTE